MTVSVRTLAFTAATAAGLALAGAASAQPFDGHHRGHGPLELLRGLQLTDAQQQQVQSIMQAGWSSMKAQHQQMHAIEQQIETKLLSPGSVSQADIAPLLQQEEQLRQSEDAAKLSATLQIRAVLTPSQLATASANHAKLAALHEQERQLAQPGSAAQPE